MMTTIAVTAPEFDKAEDVFAHAAEAGCESVRAPSPETELADAVRKRGCRHVIVGVEAYSGALYEALSAGGVIARFGVGHDGVDKESATRRGILCTNTPGVLDDSVAELTIGLMLAAARGVATVAHTTREGEWLPVVGGELRGKKLAVIGCGAIGRRVSRIASLGFGMTVVGCEVADVDVEEMARDWGFAEVVKDFGAAVSEADYVSLHIPSTEATRHLIGRERLAMLDQRAWLINPARGAVVDEAGLYDALVHGRPAGATLDVFENEPYVPVVPGKDLRTLDNVIMTPHVGSSTQEACDRMARQALRNVELAEAGRFHEMDLLNPEVCRQLSG